MSWHRETTALREEKKRPPAVLIIKIAIEPTVLGGKKTKKEKQMTDDCSHYLRI